MADSSPADSSSTSAPAVPPAAAAAGEAASQAGVDGLIAQVQAGNAAAGDAAQALQQAAGTAQDIAAVAQSAAPGTPESSPLSNHAPPSPAPPMAEMPALPSDFQPSRDPFISSPELQRLLAIEVPLIVQLGTRRMSVGEVMRFAVGAIIEFNKSADEDLDLLVNNRPIGKGQAVKVGENFGIKLTAISSIAETIRTLGGG